jgi:signal transduction histidine kinase
VIRILCVFRPEVRLFSDKQLDLLSTFADQAVIAIENSRLLRELRSRTDELSESLEYQTGTSELLRVISRSTFNLEPVLQTIAQTAADLCHADEAAIFLLDDGVYRWAASVHINNAYVDAVRKEGFVPGNDSLIGRTALQRRVVQIEDAQTDPGYGRKDLAHLGGVHTMLGVPLVRDGEMTGVMVLTRRRVERFTDKQVEMLLVFADQAVIAVENVRLITEIQEKSRQLELASQHKSQFLANMSHELRTPLNAVLGYAELMLDGIYGELPQKALGVLERVQSNGRHLLGLINDVLDLSKIEAGQLRLALDAYALPAVVQTVVAATESLASAKGLKLKAAVADGLPTGIGDERRLAQVLLNLVGNAIKFTDQGGIEIAARTADGHFEIDVIDTGPGIAPEDQARIFEEFQQVDNTSTRKKGGTGLGLAISRRIVAMHGGALTVESEVGRGSTVRGTLPVRVEKQLEAA